MGSSVAIGGVAGAAIGNTAVHVGTIVGGIVGAVGCGCLAGIARSFSAHQPSPASLPKEEEDGEPLPPVTIGKAALGLKGGIQVLYIDRRFRKQPVQDSEDKIVRVPEFMTQIAYGDWMYVGFPKDSEAKGEGATVYFSSLADQAAKYDTDIPTAIPKWFEFDEFDIPAHAWGKCIGPHPDKMPERAREGYKTKTQAAIGYLNLRQEYHINLAGVKRGDERIFFPPAVFVFQEGDVGLLVRSEDMDGNTEPTHSAEVLAKFGARANPTSDRAPS